MGSVLETWHHETNLESNIKMDDFLESAANIDESGNGDLMVKLQRKSLIFLTSFNDII
jgi:hypothetical protein